MTKLTANVGEGVNGSLIDLEVAKLSFHSNIFRLQAAELLKELSSERQDESLYHAVAQDIVEGIENSPQLSGKPSPLGLSLFSDKVKLNAAFLKPDCVIPFGPSALQISGTPDGFLDICVSIPRATFQQKDFLNYKYHSRRLHYLSQIAKALSLTKKFKKIEFGFLYHDVRKPVLVLSKDSQDNKGKPLNVRIIPVISWETFDLSKLLPNRNNHRGVKKGKDDALLATPRYNSSILEDMALLDSHNWLENHLKGKKELKEAITMLSVWATQREYHLRVDSFSETLLALITVHLGTKSGGSKLNSTMNSFQIFRAVLDNIGNSDFLSKGVFLEGLNGESNSLQLKGKQAILKAFPVVICDPLGRFNFAYRISLSALSELKYDAQLTFNSIKAEKPKAFQSTLMTKVDFASKFDVHVRITIPNPSQKETLLEVSRQTVEENKVEKIFLKALGERAKLVKIWSLGIQQNLGISKPLEEGPIEVLVGINLGDPGVAFRLVDMGPKAEDKEEAKKFRAFWGEKSELRRFKDTTIAESLVWEAPPDSKHLIISQILSFVAPRHLKIGPENIFISGSQLDWAVPQSGLKQPLGGKVQQAFDQFSQILRNLENLPLKIVSVQLINDVFGGTSVFPPIPHPLAFSEIPPKSKFSPKVPSCLQPLEVSLQLEGSGKWPDDKTALEKTKMAFLLQIAAELESSLSSPSVVSSSSVSILAFGFAFKIQILHFKDSSLLSSASPDYLSPEKDAALLASHFAHIQSLSSVHPLFGPTVRLAKRWSSCHLFSEVISPKAVELLVASLFTEVSQPFGAPKSPLVGFLRFLRLVSEHDWANSPLFVDFLGEFSLKEISQVQDHFDKLRESEGKAESKSAMFISSNYDKFSRTWTRLTPTKQHLKRYVSYAKSSAKLLRNLLASGLENEQWKSLFCTPLDVFDAIILLHEEALPFPQQTLFSAHQILQISPAQVPEMKGWNKIKWSEVLKNEKTRKKAIFVGFDPIKALVKKLKEQFNPFAEFWFDEIGGSAIGMTWKKVKIDDEKLANSPFIKFKGGIKKRKKGQQLPKEIDFEAIKQSILELGSGIFDQVYVK